MVVSKTFLFLMTLAVLRSTGQVYYKMPFNWNLYLAHVKAYKTIGYYYYCFIFRLKKGGIFLLHVQYLKERFILRLGQVISAERLCGQNFVCLHFSFHLSIQFSKYSPSLYSEGTSMLDAGD